MNKLLFTVLAVVFFSINLFAEEIPIGKVEHPSKLGNGSHNDRELIIEPRASIEEGVVLIETDVAAWGVAVTVYNSEGAVVYTAASSEDATSHEFAVGNLPAGEYVIEVQLGEDTYEGVFNI